jgi:predicted MFS family arabinose efflux permease
MSPIIWPFLFSLVMFSGFAFFAPYLVPFYQGLGFDGAQIGILSGLSPLINMAGAPYWTGLADATRKHRAILAGCMTAGAAAMLVFPLLRAFLPILVLTIIFAVFFSPIAAFSDSATMHMLGERKDLYGRVRVGGTIGFGAASPVAGYVAGNFGLQAAFWTGAALFLIGSLISLRLSYSQREPQAGQQGFNYGVFLRNPKWLVFLLIAFIGGLTLPTSISYFFPYMAALGMEEDAMGFALTIGTLAEAPILFFGNRLIKRFKPYPLLLFAMMMTAARLIWFGLIANPLMVFVIQLTNGLAFPAMWLAGVSYAEEHAPAGLKSTAQGLFAAMVFGFGNAVGGLLGGPILVNYGGRSLNLWAGIFALSTIGLIAAFTRFGRGSSAPAAPRPGDAS